MSQNDLEQKIEAILFYTAEAVEEKKLLTIVGATEEELTQAILNLTQNLRTRGIRLVQHKGTVTLVTAPEMSDVLEKMIKEERESPLGKASIETLSIIAYKGPVSKKEIEYVRGVNSDYAIRTLLLRGLIEKGNNETDGRSSVYTITTETLLHLGIQSVTELPEYREKHTELETYEKQIEETADSDTENNTQ